MHDRESQGAQHALVAAVVGGDSFNDPLTWQRSSVFTPQIQLHARLVAPFHLVEEPSGGACTEIDALLDHLGSLLLARLFGLFFRPKRSRCKARQMAASLTVSSFFVARRSFNSASVASSWWATNFSSVASCCLSGERFPPPGGKAAQFWVVRQQRKSFSTNERLTPNSSAISG